MSEEAGPIPAANYASEDPVPSEVLIEEVGRLQALIDAQTGEIDDLSEKQSEAKKERERLREKLAVIGRARRNGKPLFMLKGGELTGETPPSAKPTGPLFDNAGVIGGPPSEPPTEPVVETPKMAPIVDIHPLGYEPPLDWNGYGTASCPGGGIATVTAEAGAWWARIDGKPYALGVKTAAEACRLVEKEFPDRVLSWSVSQSPASGGAV